MDTANNERASILVAGLVGGLVGGITALLLSNPKRRHQLLTTLSSLDEKTLELRPYIARRIAEYGHAVESEMKRSAEEILMEAKRREQLAN
jgi:hypothetical protein